MLYLPLKRIYALCIYNLNHLLYEFNLKGQYRHDQQGMESEG